jgi:hypothetical protein
LKEALVLAHADDGRVTAALSLPVGRGSGHTGVVGVLAARTWHIVERHESVLVWPLQELEERLSVLVLRVLELLRKVMLGVRGCLTFGYGWSLGSLHRVGVVEVWPFLDQILEGLVMVPFVVAAGEINLALALRSQFCHLVVGVVLDLLGVSQRRGLLREWSFHVLWAVSPDVHLRRTLVLHLVSGLLRYIATHFMGTMLTQETCTLLHDFVEDVH